MLIYFTTLSLILQATCTAVMDQQMRWIATIMLWIHGKLGCVCVVFLFSLVHSMRNKCGREGNLYWPFDRSPPPSEYEQFAVIMLSVYVPLASAWMVRRFYSYLVSKSLFITTTRPSQISIEFHPKVFPDLMTSIFHRLLCSPLPLAATK
jgi:hypothetical protein